MLLNNYVDDKNERELLPEEIEEIKEYHFHVYFLQCNRKSRESAEKLRNEIFELIQKKFFHPVPYHIFNDEPTGPHIIGSYEVWCPKEHFSRVYSWFLLHRGEHSVMIHPLTKNETRDHSENAVWMGKSMPLDLTPLSSNLPEVPAQYPELKMGYSESK